MGYRRYEIKIIYNLVINFYNISAILDKMFIKIFFKWQTIDW